MALMELFNSAVALLGLWIFVFFFYRNYRLDLFRQEIFTIRDELFDYGASGAVSFSDPAYLLLRKFMNQTIRYAHILTFSRYIVAALLGRRYSPDFTNPVQKWRERVDDIEAEEVRNKLLEFHDRVGLAIADQLLRRSLFLFSIGTLLAVIARIVTGSTASSQEVVKQEQIEALEVQMIESEEQERRMLRGTAAA
jgi:hypothetical protein